MARPSDRRLRKRKEREKRKRKQQAIAAGDQHGQDSRPSPGPTLRDVRRLLESNLMLGSKSQSERNEAEAQEHVYQAWECSDPDQVWMHVREALALDPDCVDALAIAANSIEKDNERIKALRSVVGVAERKLGEDFFIENRGYFWGLVQTRPYMRTRSALAEALTDAGRRKEAIEHLEEMLELSRDDNMGNRHVLRAHYLAEGRADDARRILDQFSDEIDWGDPAWASVLERCLARDTDGARKALADARKSNAAVEAYLLGKRRLPQHRPEYLSPGDESEAVTVALNQRDAWQAHPKALAWLASGGAENLTSDARGTDERGTDERGTDEHAPTIGLAASTSESDFASDVAEDTKPRSGSRQARLLDARLLERLADEFNSRLGPLAKSLGVEISVADWKWSPANAMFRVEVATRRDDGVVMNASAERFLVRARDIGLEPSDLGRVLEIGRGRLRIVGAMPRKKDEVFCEDLSNGQIFRVPVSAIRAHLNRAPKQLSLLEPLDPDSERERPSGRRCLPGDEPCSCGSGIKMKLCCLRAIGEAFEASDQ